MVHKVDVMVQLGQGMTVTHSFEQVIDNTDEARQFGDTCATLMASFNVGFGEAETNV